MNTLLTTNQKLKIVEQKFRKGSKSYQAARFLAQHEGNLDEENKKIIAREIGMSPRTLEGVFTKLRKLNILDTMNDISNIEHKLQSAKIIPPRPPNKPSEIIIDPVLSVDPSLYVRCSYCGQLSEMNPLIDNRYEFIQGKPVKRLGRYRQSLQRRRRRMK